MRSPRASSATARASVMPPTRSASRAKASSPIALAARGNVGDGLLQDILKRLPRLLRRPRHLGKERRQRAAFFDVAAMCRAEIACGDPLQPVRTAGHIVRRRLEKRARLPKGVRQRFGEQGFLGGKVRIEAAGREPGLTHHLIDAGGMIALAAEDRRRRGQDALPRLLLVPGWVSHSSYILRSSFNVQGNERKSACGLATLGAAGIRSVISTARRKPHTSAAPCGRLRTRPWSLS